MADPSTQPTAQKVSRWWRVIASGLIAGIAVNLAGRHVGPTAAVSTTRPDVDRNDPDVDRRVATHASSSSDDPSKATVVRVYDVRPLLDEMRAEHAKRGGAAAVVSLSLQNASQGTARNCTPQSTEPGPYLPEEELNLLIVSLVQPESWVACGGCLGTTSTADGFFIIRQTEANHLQIEKLLGNLRRH